MKAKYIYGLVYLSLAPALAFAEGKGIQVGDAKLYPALNLSTGYDSNITQKSDDQGNAAEGGFVDSFYLDLTGGLNLKRKKGDASTYTAGIDFIRRLYTDSSTDNYTDYTAHIDGLWQFTHRASLSLALAYLRNHYGRGTTDYFTSESKVEKANTVGINGLFVYGRPAAKARIQVDGGYSTLRHKSDDLAFGEDRDQMNLGATLFYKLRPKTDLLVQLKNTATDYDQESRDLDSNNSTFNVGATWYATSKTDADVRLGYTRKDFDSDAHDDYSGFSWEMSGQWRPKTHSLVDISTARITENPTGFGDNIETSYFSIDWTYAWTERWSHTLGFYAHSRDFFGAIINDAPTSDAYLDRTDRKRDYNLQIRYAWKKWLSLLGGVKSSHRTSTIPGNDYDRLTWIVGLNMSLDYKFSAFEE